MGQQQLLLLILGVIIVGIAVSVGIAQFGADSTNSNKDGVMSGLQNIAAHAYQYKIRPQSLGGGSNEYTSYVIPPKMIKDENGVYTLGTITPTSIQILGTSAVNTAWVATCTQDDSGAMRVVFNGW